MIKIFTNTLGSGDWIYIKDTQGRVLFEGHGIGIGDLKWMLQQLGHDTEIHEISDERMEEGFDL